MVTKKDLVIVTLATFCLTATLFLVNPTRSSPNTAGVYDPWVDVNGDGKIDILDLVQTALSWHTSGDPTKDVNVTNWPNSINVKDTVFSWSSGIQHVTYSEHWDSGYLSTVGFRQFTVNVQADDLVWVYVWQRLGDTDVAYDKTITKGYTETYDVVGTECYISIGGSSDSVVAVSCSVYMDSIPRQLPSYSEQTVPVNFSQGFTGVAGIRCDGYSRLSISADGGFASEGTYSATVCMFAIQWPSTTQEFFSADAFNVTFIVSNGRANLQLPYPPPFVIETKGSKCTLEWELLSGDVPPGWWISFPVHAYLRNE